MISIMTNFGSKSLSLFETKERKKRAESKEEAYQIQLFGNPDICWDISIN